LLVIFVPTALLVIPILVPINYNDGIGQRITQNVSDASDDNIPTGLDTIAFGNVKPVNQHRRWAHLILALLVIVWVCFVSFAELRVYVKIRQDYLTSAEHRLRASANTVLVSGIPEKWLTEDALRGLFDVFPGGIRNIWLNRDFTKLLDKIKKRDDIHKQLESAESDLIREAKRKQLKKREKEEKKARKEHKQKAMSKAEKMQRQKEEDAEAQRRAEGHGGLSAGDHEDVPNVDTAIEDARDNSDEQHLNRPKPHNEDERGGKIPIIGGGLTKLGQGLKEGVGVFGKAGQGIFGGVKSLGEGVDDQLERTGGFEFVKSEDNADTSPKPPTRGSDRPRRVVQILDDEEKPKMSFGSDAGRSNRSHTVSGSQTSTPQRNEFGPQAHGNTTRKLANPDDMYVQEDSKWWQFWKPPSGAYASPVPQGAESDEFPFGDSKETKSFWAKVKSKLPFVGGDDEEPIDYPSALNPDYVEDDEQAEWRKWLKQSDRPTHRLPLFDWTPGWLPGLPLIHKKVDTIDWCRKELARLNMEIEEDQQHPERYPIMTSAFIQFNNQVAAHMACQSVTHHVPKHMAPRVVEVSPKDVIWDNMAMKWWDEWLRYLIVIGLVAGMTILWAIPVAFTSSLAQLDSVVARYPWLGFLKSTPQIATIAQAVCGVLPALLLALLLFLVPVIFNFLAKFQGAKTGAQRSEYVQRYYFFFLFVQVFLVVSIAGGAFATLQKTFTNVQSVPALLASDLPKTSNYFFSYMILQALSTSSGTLLQIGTLFVWFILSRILDNTARSKWSRQTTLPNISWGSFFPTYTNFACIGLVYCIIAPIISIFAIITFSLLWFAQRYNMIYVTRFKNDTGGVLYPRAINQTFTGLYFMELCLVGLFFLARDEQGQVACAPQAIIMIVALILTVLYQILLNLSFGPLLRYLPITFEDEAVLRDEAFQRAQDRRLGLLPDDDEATALTTTRSTGGGTDGDGDIELQKLENRGRHGTGSGALRHITQAGTWAIRGGKRARHATFGKAQANLKTAAQYRRERRQKDLESQRAIGEALYGGYHDEIEDLTPEERDALVKEAFKHEALRSRRPTVWIPRDDLGVSDDEILRTRELSDYIWISNEGTALDSKVRVVYGRAPPDFSDIELIDL